MTDETEDQRWERLSQDKVDRPLPRRFYKDVAVGEGNKILLDGRAVKTPLKAAFSLPTHPLAEAVADEWRAQEKLINPALMPLTKLANTAIDRAGPERAHVAGEVVGFAGSDLVFYRADAPEKLVALQAAAWDPILDWAKQALDARFLGASGIIYVKQPEAALRAVEAHIAGLDAFKLTAVHNLTTLTGSALLALMIHSGAIDSASGWAAAHVDEDYQISTWGEDHEAARRRANRKADFEGTVKFLSLLKN
ncbi:ATP12 family chaperone protein [Aestuariivirga litoralis]|uniref:ATP12 family chaperone protein n=1 Tax=Aestuariivirga litoralis TaxID=2650924 RepID=UPI0018C4F0AD|nr:ATP12 family protein [Aestuariivirga litoralis]MBG1231701.1 ATPase [Aestuariivirga litoralis]